MRNRNFRILLTVAVIVALAAALTVPAFAAIRVIVDPDSPVLHAKTRSINAFNDSLGELLDDLWSTLESRGAGAVGLSAPEIGVSKSVCVVDVGSGRLELVNPVVVWSEGSSVETEGCIAAPGWFAEVSRPERIRVQYMDRNGQPCELEAEGFLARIILHEIDHLNGVTIFDANAAATALSEGSVRVIIGCSALAVGMAAGLLIGRRAGQRRERSAGD